MLRLGLLLVLATVLLLPAPVAATRQPVIVFFGDSLTAGLHASRWELTYRQVLSTRLTGTRDAGRTAAVIQHPLGLLDDAQARLPQVLAARPTLVFVELGHHEIDADDDQFAQFEPRYADILDRLIASGADVVPSTLAWLGYRRDSFEYQRAMYLNSIVRRLAAERDLPVADLWTPTENRLDLLSTPNDFSFLYPYTGDDFHPNDAGHQALADAFWKAYRALRTRSLLGRLMPL